MSLITVEYYYLSCDGPSNVPWEKNCSATSPGSFSLQEMEEEAARIGWTKGRKRYCAQHQHLAKPTDADTDEAAPVKPRGRRRTSGEAVAAVSVPLEHDGQGDQS